MPKLRVIIKPPPEPQGDAEQQTEALRDYLLQMSEELAYVLTHLEADNINDSTFERIQNMIPRPYTGLPVMDGDASSGQSEQWARGDHRHGHDSTKADVTALATETAAREAHEADTGNPHEVTKSQVGLGNVANERQYSEQNPPPIPTPGEVGAIPATEKGSAGGVAELDSNGMVPSAQLPSYVDDVLEYASLSDFPVTGESGKIYVAQDTNKTYRWSGSAYVEISESLALGETSSTAYRGDRGKAAYDHSQVTSGNPHNVTAAEVGLGNVANERQYSAQNPPPLPTPADIGAATAQDLTDHVGDTNNPHSVTAAQVGVVPNPADPATDTLTKMQVGSKIYEITGGGGGGPSPYISNPAMDGTASPGSSNDYARGDHVHPTDTSRASASDVASLNERYTDNTIWRMNTDANDYKTSGLYAMATGNANVPAPWGILFVQGPISDTIEQEYRYANNIWNREFRNNAWSEWTLTGNQAQLAYVETGTTASQNYTAGQYISLNGLLYTADTAIAIGATFYTSGGNKNLTECVGGGFNALRSAIGVTTTVSVDVWIGGYGLYILNIIPPKTGAIPFACGLTSAYAWFKGSFNVITDGNNGSPGILITNLESSSEQFVGTLTVYWITL